MLFIYFIVDLYLSVDCFDIIECLMCFLKEDVINVDVFYVFGDLFEVWIGDDNVILFNIVIVLVFKVVS